MERLDFALGAFVHNSKLTTLLAQPYLVPSETDKNGMAIVKFSAASMIVERTALGER